MIYGLKSNNTSYRYHLLLNESFNECELLGQMDRQMTDGLVLGSLGMTDSNHCSHEMTKSLMVDLDMF